MPGSTRTFEYSLVPTSAETVTRLEKRAAKILGWACEGDDRITCHQVTGSALGVVTLSMTICARDRWWATQLAQDVLNTVTWGLETGATQTQLRSHRQDPHTHRGYAHGRTKRHRDASSSSATAAGADTSSSSSSSSSDVSSGTTTSSGT